MERAKFWATHFLLAICVVLACFPDVIFNHASIRPSDIGSSPYAGSSYRSDRNFSRLWQPRTGRAVHHGFNDLGTSVWGLEPGQLFLSQAIKNHDSPFWNPFSSAGELGVESLTDSKFSPFSIVVAALGGGSDAYNFSYLTLMMINLAFLAAILAEFFSVTAIARTAALLFFTLNGFHASNITNILVEPLIFSPALLYFLLRFKVAPTPSHFFASVFCHLALFAGLFPATTLLLMIFIWGVAIVFDTDQLTVLPPKRYAAFLIGSASVALVILSPILYPTIQSWKWVETFKAYNGRTYVSADFYALLGYFTPRLFWESYNSFFSFRPVPEYLTSWSNASWIHHCGIAALILASQGFLNPQFRRATLFIGVAVLISLARALNNFPFTLMDHLPIFRSIQPGYWNCVVAMGTTFLVGFGVENIVRTRRAREGLLILCGLFGMCAAWYLSLARFNIGPEATVYLCLSLLLLGGCSWLVLNERFPYRLRAHLLVVILFFEMMSYLNPIRPYRLKSNPTSDAMVPFKQQLAGEWRTLSIGRDFLAPEWGAAYHIRQASGFRESYLPWYKTYFNLAFGNTLQDLEFENTDMLRLNSKMADFLSIRYFIASRYIQRTSTELKLRKFPLVFENEKVQIFENPTYQPRARLFYSVRKQDAGDDANFKLDPLTIQTSDDQFLELAQQNSVATTPDKLSHDHDFAEIVRESNAEVQIHAVNARPAILSLSDAWYPRWFCLENSKPCYVAKANLAFRAVVLKPGEHNVVFQYRPYGQSFTIPLALTAFLISLGGLLYGLLPRPVRSRK